METSVAYQVGQVIGVILGIMFFIGVCVLFVVALVKAIKTRRRGWVITAVISGVPCLALLVLFLVGVCIGVGKAISLSRETSITHRQADIDLLKEPLSPVAGNAMAYEVSIPALNRWTKGDAQGAFDYIFVYHDAYLGIIAENIGVGTPQKVCDISRKNLASKASTFSATDPVAADIGSHSWLTYDATAMVEGISIKYRFYVYADSEYTIQLIGWTGPVVFERYAPVFDRIAKSFKLPK